MNVVKWRTIVALRYQNALWVAVDLARRVSLLNQIYCSFLLALSELQNKCSIESHAHTGSPSTT